MFLMIKQIFDAIDDSFVVIVFDFIKYFLDILIGSPYGQPCTNCS